MKIAILGATGYIGRSLMHECGSRADLEATPFTRDPEAARAAWRRFGIDAPAEPRGQDSFLDQSFDIVINADGVGSPSRLKRDPIGVIHVTATMDALLHSYLKEFPETRVFHLGSGAIYGENAGGPIADGTPAVFRPDRLKPGDCYALAKLSSEAAHRALPEFAIVDLRVFSFFSRFVDTEDTFFLSEAAAALRDDRVFQTSKEDMVRDFTTAASLLDAVMFLAAAAPANRAFDLRSLEPASKFDLLRSLSEKFGLRYETVGAGPESPTGPKQAYHSASTALSALGFLPKETSLQAIEREMREFLKLRRLTP